MRYERKGGWDDLYMGVLLALRRKRNRCGATGLLEEEAKGGGGRPPPSLKPSSLGCLSLRRMCKVRLLKREMEGLESALFLPASCECRPRWILPRGKKQQQKELFDLSSHLKTNLLCHTFLLSRPGRMPRLFCVQTRTEAKQETPSGVNRAGEKGRRWGETPPGTRRMHLCMGAPRDLGGGS